MKQHWQSEPIGSLCQLINGRAFKPSDWTQQGLPIVRIQNLNDETKPFNYYDGEIHSKHLVEDGDVLLSWSGTPGTSFGCFVWSRGQAILNQHIFKVLVDTTKMLKEFFVHAVNSRLDEMISLAHGGVGLRHITKKKLGRIELPVPPLSEQRRIVGQIQEAFERIREIQMLRRESLAESAALESAVFSDFIMELTRNANVSVVPIGDIAQVNPRRDRRLRSLDEDLEVTFVPMAAVDEETGTIASPEVKPLGDVRKGFTPFLQGDVIFAKITPCMQNGKSAIAQSLVNELGFGSTEFHVLRPGPVVLSQWLWYFVRQRSFREEARRHFRGSAGQQRVPATFVEQHKIPLPSLEQQRRIVSRIQERLKRVNELCRLLRFTPTRKVRNQIDANTSAADPNALMQAVLRKAFAGEL